MNWSLRNKLQWNFNRNSNIFIKKNVFESVVCEMASILSRPQCVKGLLLPTSWFMRHYLLSNICPSIFLFYPRRHLQLLYSWIKMNLTHPFLRQLSQNLTLKIPGQRSLYQFISISIFSSILIGPSIPEITWHPERDVVGHKVKLKRNNNNSNNYDDNDNDNDNNSNNSNDDTIIITIMI